MGNPYVYAPSDLGDTDGPEAGDWVIETRYSDYAVSALGDFNGARSFVEFDDAIAYIKSEMDRQKFWPNIWNLSDHGNWSLYTDS